MITQRFQKYPIERRTLSIDFADELPVGVTMSSVTLTARDPDFVDATSTVIDGSPQIDGTTVKFAVKAGTGGLIYALQFDVTLSNTDKLVEQADLEVLLSRKPLP